MPEPTVPEDVYRAALEAKGRAAVPEASDAAIAEYVTSMLAPGRGAGVRAAVEIAYRAGQTRLVERVRELANEQFQAGNPWPAGTQLTAEGIRDMLVLLVTEAADG